MHDQYACLTLLRRVSSSSYAWFVCRSMTKPTVSLTETSNPCARSSAALRSFTAVSVLLFFFSIFYALKYRR